jgi:DNA recombination protein RmuC
MYLPNDAFLSAALEKDAGLQEFAMARRVVLATPMHFIVLMRSFASDWQQERLSRNAQEISDLGRELHDRLRTFVGKHLASLGRGLAQATSSYNAAVASLEAKVMPAARKFDQLGTQGTSEEIPSLRLVDVPVREIADAYLAAAPVAVPDAQAHDA